MVLALSELKRLTVDANYEISPVDIPLPRLLRLILDSKDSILLKFECYQEECNNIRMLKKIINNKFFDEPLD